MSKFISIQSPLQQLSVVGVFMVACGYSLSEYLNAVYTLSDAQKQFTESVSILIVAYLIFWPYIVIGVSNWGFSVLSIVVLLQLFYPTAIAGITFADGLEALE